MKASRLALAFVTFATFFFVLAVPRPLSSAERAELKPGIVIDRYNADSFTPALTPALLWAVRHGLKLKVQPSRHVEWPEEYQQATEKYGGQVSLDSDDLPQNHVAGLPFPNIDPTDPKAAVKIAYDWRWGPFVPDQVSLSGIGARTFTFSADALSFRDDSFNPDFRNESLCDRGIALKVAHRLNATGSDKDGTSGVEWQERFEGCGPTHSKVIALLYAGERQPDSYIFLLATRRWRRFAMPMVPNQSCSYSCVQTGMDYIPPQTGVYSWSLAGTQTMLGCLDGGAAFNQQQSSMNFGQISCEPRSVYILDMRPRRSGTDLLSGRVYIDAETYLYLGGEFYRDQNPDLSAALWRREKSPEGGDRMILSADLYVPDEPAGTFLWLDLTGRQSFDSEISQQLFNPKAEIEEPSSVEARD